MGKTNPGTQYWTYSLVDGIPTWDELVKGRIMSIGWDELGDLGLFSSKDEVSRKMGAHDPNKELRNDPAAAYEFVHSMKQGDIVYVRQGNQLVGRGIVDSDYQFDKTREYGKSVRRMIWEQIEKRPVPEGYGNKRLTNVTNSSDFIEELTGPDIKYYWVNQSKDFKKDSALGIIKAPTRDVGNGRQWHWEMLTELKPGDKLLSYVKGNVVSELTVKSTFHLGMYEYEKRGVIEHYVVDVYYDDSKLKHPVSLETIKRGIKFDDVNIRGCPFTKDFAARQIYCGRSTKDLHDFVLEQSVNQQNTSHTEKVGENILLYGVPGSGKSRYVKEECLKGIDPDKYMRILFHPDYTYSDFIGQILPVVRADKSVTYEFIPGPFTTIVSRAYGDKNNSYFLIIEEINRGNAPAIFGDVFQLLDRAKVDGTKHNSVEYPKGVSEYSIDHKDMAAKIYGEGKENYKVFIPPNLKIIATMNTSDQNVFTLDTAFQRRWNMRLIRNTFEGVDEKFSGAAILDTGVTWKTFCTQINDLIAENNTEMVADKRLGVYFVCMEDLLEETDEEPTTENQTQEATQELAQKGVKEIKNQRFSEKVIKYLWDDAFKFNRDVLFNTEKITTLEKAIDEFNGVAENGFQRFEKIFSKKFCDLIRPSVTQAPTAG